MSQPMTTTAARVLSAPAQYHLDHATDAPAPLSSLLPGATATFFQFKDLPVEIRTMIWMLASASPYILEIRAQRLADGSLIPFTKSQPIWNIDKRARGEAKDILHYIELCLPRCRFIYNPETDLLYISHRTEAHFHRQDVFSALRSANALKNVRAIAVDYLGDSDATIPGWDIDPLPLREMKSLELIFVVLEDMEDGYQVRRTPFALDPMIEPNYNREELEKLVAVVGAKWKEEWKDEEVEKPAPRVEFVWERGY